MSFKFDFNLKTKIIFGAGTYEARLGEEASKLGEKTIIVTGRTSTKRTGLLDKTCKILEKAGIKYKIYDKVEPNPSIETIHAGADLAKEFEPDFLIGLGGGSPIDASKAIGIIYTLGGHISDYFGVEKVKKPIIPILASPTTSGTGAEVTKYSNINDNKAKTKNLINSLNICPAVAIVDPTLTLTMPPKLAAISGIDALTHVVESYVCTFSQPLTELINLEAIRIIGKYLPISVNLQRDVEAHYWMSYASLLGGITINNAGTGIAHGLSFPLTANYRVPHGVATGLLLPYVMEFNMPTNYEKFAKIAEALGVRVEGLSTIEAAERSVSAVKRLMRDIGFPKSLAEYGVEDDKIKEFAENLMANVQKLANNPRMPTTEDIIHICKMAKDVGIRE